MVDLHPRLWLGPSGTQLAALCVDANVSRLETARSLYAAPLSGARIAESRAARPIFLAQLTAQEGELVAIVGPGRELDAGGDVSETVQPHCANACAAGTPTGAGTGSSTATGSVAGVGEPASTRSCRCGRRGCLGSGSQLGLGTVELCSSCGCFIHRSAGCAFTTDAPKDFWHTAPGPD